MDFYQMFTGLARKAAGGNKGSRKDSSEEGRPLYDILGQSYVEPMLTHAHDLALELKQKILAESKRYMDDMSTPHRAMLATMFMFAVAWSIIGWLWKGAKASREKYGERGSPVFQMWELMEATFGAADNADLKERSAALTKKWNAQGMGGDDE